MSVLCEAAGERRPTVRASSLPHLLLTALVSVVLAMVATPLSAQSCSGISGGKGGYISGGNCPGSVTIPSAPRSGNGGTVYRGSGGGGRSYNNLGAAAGAAAAILGGLGGGSSSHSSADCDGLLRTHDAVQNEWASLIVKKAFASTTDKCQATRDFYEATVRKFEATETWLFACNGSYTTQAVGLVNESNFYSVRQHDLTEGQQDLNKACHQTAEMRRRCEGFASEKAYNEARSCFMEVRDIAIQENEQPTVDRANYVIEWVDAHEKREAHAAVVKNCDDQVTAKAYVQARTCFQALKDDSEMAGDPVVMRRANYIIDWVDKFEQKRVAVKTCEDNVTRRAFGAARACFQRLRGADFAKDDAAIQQRATYIIGWVDQAQAKVEAAAAALAAQKRYGGSDPFASGNNPFADAVPTNPTAATSFDAPGAYLYSSIPEDNVYGTAFYRDGTTKRP